MEQTISRFNLYDHLGYISVGFFSLLIFISIFLLNYYVDLPTIDVGFGDGVLLLLACYVIGHIIQSISNLIIIENKGKPDSSYDHIIEKVKRVFGLESNTKPAILFQYAYLSSVGKDPSGHISLFNSLHSFYRGLFTAVFLASFVLLVFTIYYSRLCDTKMVIFNTLGLVAGLLLAYIFNLRRKRFYSYMGQKVWIIFDILHKEVDEDDSQID